MIKNPCVLVSQLSNSDQAFYFRFKVNIQTYIFTLNVITNVLEYKASLNLKFKCVCVTMCSLVMSLFSCDFLM